MTMLNKAMDGTGGRRCPVCQADLKFNRRVTMHCGGAFCRLCGHEVESADACIRINPRQIAAWLRREA